MISPGLTRPPAATMTTVPFENPFISFFPLFRSSSSFPLLLPLLIFLFFGRSFDPLLGVELESWADLDHVLLDDCCEAVVGDFGLAKLLDHRDSHVTTAVRGTVGHIAPEYLSTGQSSDKTDVFGFGILLLELVTGQRALEFGKGPNQKGAMLDWVRKVYQEKQLDLLVDRDLGSSYDRIEVGEMLQVALLCTQFLPSRRPRMSEVLRMLEGDGLAEKWEASNRPPTHPDAPIAHHQSDSNACFVMNSDDNGGSTDDDDDDDDHSMDVLEEMELSGPR